MDEIKLLKFEAMIEGIDRNFRGSDRKSDGMNVALALIFDYDRCNEYAKKIFKISHLNVITDIHKHGNRVPMFMAPECEQWDVKYNDIKLFNEIKTKIEATKSFVKCCTDEKELTMFNKKWLNLSQAYKLVFWSLFILTVDRYNADEYLSTICDVTRLLRISNEDFKSIINLIKCIYKREVNVNEISDSNIFRWAFGGNVLY